MVTKPFACTFQRLKSKQHLVYRWFPSSWWATVSPPHAAPPHAFYSKSDNSVWPHLIKNTPPKKEWRLSCYTTWTLCFFKEHAGNKLHYLFPLRRDDSCLIRWKQLLSVINLCSHSSSMQAKLAIFHNLHEVLCDFNSEPTSQQRQSALPGLQLCAESPPRQCVDGDVVSRSHWRALDHRDASPHFYDII